MLVCDLYLSLVCVCVYKLNKILLKTSGKSRSNYLAVFLPTSYNSFVLRDLCFANALSTNFVCTFPLIFLFVFYRMVGFNKIRIYALSPGLQEACAIVRLKFKGKKHNILARWFQNVCIDIFCMCLSRSAVLFISRWLAHGCFCFVFTSLAAIYRLQAFTLRYGSWQKIESRGSYICEFV